MRIVITIILTIAYMVIVPARSWGAVFEVKTANELHNALDIANGNGEDDQINIYEGTYYGNFFFGQSVSESGKMTRISGGYTGEGEQTNDPAKTILDGGQQDCVLKCNVCGPIIIMNLTFQNGKTNSSGGGLSISHHPYDNPRHVFIQNNIFQNNQSSKMGGGLYAESFSKIGKAGNIWLVSNRIMDNTAENSMGGGGAFLRIFTGSISKNTGHIMVIDNTISENSVPHGPGGGLSVLLKSDTGPVGRIFIGVNTIQDNNADDCGGGIYIESTSAVSSSLSQIILSENTIEDNRTGASGGGVNIEATTEEGTAPAIRFTKNNILLNSAVKMGGGVIAESKTMAGIGGDIIFNGNMISKNNVYNIDGICQAGGIRLASAGAFTNCAGDVVLTNNIIVENTSSHMDGGAAITGNIILTNNTIANNEAVQYCGGAFLYGDPDVSVYNNIIWGNSPRDIRLLGCCTFDSYNNDYSTIDGSWSTEVDRINADPLFTSSTDYHLQSTSPCIDAGTSTAPYLPSEDFDGNNRNMGAAPDIGADEFKYLFIPGPFPGFPYYELIPRKFQHYFRGMKELDDKKLKREIESSDPIRKNME